MVTLTLSLDTLTVDMTGVDHVLALKSHLEVALSHVVEASIGIPADVQAEFNHLWRLPGSYMPGIAIAGTFTRNGKTQFWAIHSGTNAITIRLAHDTFTALVLEVDEPAALVAEIQAAINKG